MCIISLDRDAVAVGCYSVIEMYHLRMLGCFIACPNNCKCPGTDDKAAEYMYTGYECIQWPVTPAIEKPTHVPRPVVKVQLCDWLLAVLVCLLLLLTADDNQCTHTLRSMFLLSQL